ncbi:MAG: bifunctional precorrin-2 dehydrogenase/sirohydrochlorin ferrochelatase [Halohasta sp.]
MIPLYHDFSGARVLVFGGGPVGARKARRFAREADVVTVSPAFVDGFDEPALAAVDRVRAAPDPADAVDWVDRVDPALVVAATDDSALNRAAAEAARDYGALVNRADQSGERDVDSVVVPATVRDDPVSVAISTGGESPALARYLRQRIESEIEDAGAMAALSGRLRSDLKAAGVPPADRRAAVRSVVRSSSVWKALHTRTSNPEKEAERVMAVEHDDMEGTSR